MEAEASGGVDRKLTTSLSVDTMLNDELNRWSAKELISAQADSLHWSRGSKKGSKHCKDSSTDLS